MCAKSNVSILRISRWKTDSEIAKCILTHNIKRYLTSSTLHKCITRVDWGSNYNIGFCGSLKLMSVLANLLNNSGATHVWMSSLNWAVLYIIYMYVFIYAYIHMYKYTCLCMYLFRAAQSETDLKILADLSPSVTSYLTTTLNPGTEYQFQLMASVGNMTQPASDTVSITTEPIGIYLCTKLLHTYIMCVCTYMYKGAYAVSSVTVLRTCRSIHTYVPTYVCTY